ncbi:hypothetical protein EI94DRAFT_1706845 [Lactarius quietus]|nr:hypothetical protein EI94DRAFT_1706845 [Lactarius quietus]
MSSKSKASHLDEGADADNEADKEHKACPQPRKPPSLCHPSSRPKASHSTASSLLTRGGSLSCSTNGSCPPLPQLSWSDSHKKVPPSISEIICTYTPPQQQARSHPSAARDSMRSSNHGHQTAYEDELESEPEPVSAVEEAKLVSRTSVDSVAEEVNMMLHNQTTPPSFKLPLSAPNPHTLNNSIDYSPQVHSFSPRINRQSPRRYPLVVFLGLGGVRYVSGLYDEMAECLGIRLITIDSILMAHSAGAPYALSFVNKVPEHICGEISRITATTTKHCRNSPSPLGLPPSLPPKPLDVTPTSRAEPRPQSHTLTSPKLANVVTANREDSRSIPRREVKFRNHQHHQCRHYHQH